MFRRRRGSEDSTESTESTESTASAESAEGATDDAVAEETPVVSRLEQLLEEDLDEELVAAEAAEGDAGAGAGADDATGGSAAAAATASAPASRANGPFDSSEVEDDGGSRLDLGSLCITPVETIDIRVEMEQESGRVTAVTLVSGESVLQVGAFAAPRNEGIWDEVRGEISSSITKAGGTVDVTEGEFGTEMRATVRGQDDKGRATNQVIRFIGVDGPRWFVRGLLSGPAVDDAAAAAPLLATFRAMVVVRGTSPMAPHEPLPLNLPQEPEEGAEGEAGRPDLNPFRRGPEITEIR